jgi:uncharacterized protein YbjT (DUF2867 family)
MGMTDLFAVTGATGGLGGRVARRLADLGLPLRLVVRDASQAPTLPGATVAPASYSDGASLRSALADIDTLFLVSARESADRLAQHFNVVDTAAAAGVRRVVYTSFLGASPDATFTLARHHWATEERIRSTPMAFTFLRNSLYQDLLPYFPDRLGVLRAPAGSGRVAPVARDDLADAAVGALTGSGFEGHTYDLTGPQLLTLEEVAATMSAASGREIRYVPETVEEAYASREVYAAPGWEVTGWVTSYTAIAAGEMAVVSDGVALLAGHPPMKFSDHLATSPAALAHLRGETA